MSEKKSNSPEANENTDQKTEIAIIDERTIRDRIYVVRGVQVMLDFELAEIYGYFTAFVHFFSINRHLDDPMSA